MEQRGWDVVHIRGPQHPAYRDLARPGRLERSERLAREVLSLPLYPELTDDEAAAVINAVREACRV